MSKKSEQEALKRAVLEQTPAVEGCVGLGVDIVDIARMARILERTPSFERKVFSAEEIAYCRKTGNPEAHFACRFAAKEAVLKALGTGFSEGIGPLDVSVTRSAKGKPAVVLQGRAREVAQEMGVVDLPLSLSHTHNDAVACAMAITARSVQAVEERIDQKEELAKRFKQARSFLDEL
ncbi:holo-ACP synthase [Adlercreutzia aquisgranensis]|nr:holo-ACP synthase [Adlercreutzia aquisgranensis]